MKMSSLWAFTSWCRAWLGQDNKSTSLPHSTQPESQFETEAVAPTPGIFAKYKLEQAFENLVRLAAQISKAPVACLRLPDADAPWIFFPTNLIPESLATYSTICMQIVREKKMTSSTVIIEDVTKQPHISSILQHQPEPAIQTFVALPLQSKEKEDTGYLFIIDHEPRSREGLAVDFLSLVAQHISEHLKMYQHLTCLEEVIDDYQIAERRWMTQYEVTQVLAESHSLPDATPRLLQAVCNGLDWEVGLLWKVDEPSNVLRCIELWHKPTVSLPVFSKLSFEITFASGIGLPGRVWFSRDARWIPDVTRDSNFPRMQAARAEGLHGAFGFPIQWNKKVLGVLEFFSHEIRQPDETLLKHFTAIGNQIGQFAERKRVEREQEELIQKLKDAFSEVKTLSGLLPICASCKKVRDDQGYWHQIEKYIEKHSQAEVSHGLCRECARKLYPEYYEEVQE